jgi:drug/metabolite transporter (DMT)-like permease
VSTLALGLVLVAAVLHATWNLVIKQASDRLVVVWWALGAGSLLFLPVLLRSPVPRGTWPFLASSAVAECGYYALLAYAYARADLSQVYPVARGGAPALLTIWAALLLSEYPSPAGWAALALILAGLVVVASARADGWWGRGAWLPGPGVAAALGMAFFTSAYSLIDGVAVRRTLAAPYTVAVIALTALLLTPLILWRHGVRAAVATLRKEWLRVVVAGALTLLVYGLVLQAYTMARLAYAAAVREVSVVVAALAGWLLLGEPFGRRRLAGAVAVFSGIVILATLG